MIGGFPPSADTLLQGGLELLHQGRVGEAMSAFEAALRLDPKNALAHHMIGLVALQAGQLEAGVESLRRAIDLNPADLSAYANLANGLRELGLVDQALEAYDRTIDMVPTLVNAYDNRAVLFARLDRFEEALADYDRALALNGRAAFVHNHRATTLRELGRHYEALNSCATALRLDPRYVDAYLNRASALGEIGRFEEAIADYEACLALDPGRTEAVVAIGSAYLAMGDYDRGWERYEARLRLQGRKRVAPTVAFAQPAWNGADPLSGKTILLHSEQGLGDTLQFCRYVPSVKAMGAEIVLQVEPSLVRLSSSLRGVDRVVAKGHASPHFDVQASIMSLPRAFRTTLQSIPADVPYLHAEPDKVAVWAGRLGPATRPRVGLVWSGGQAPQRRDLFRRNIPLRMLAPLAQCGVDFVSLQKGEPAESELAEVIAFGWNGPAILDPAADLHDFSDTAALVENLDLVITVDTSVAHLAGGLGKPVWILNRLDADWRWMRDRTDSPWYPTARLFRQKTFGDWAFVVQEVAAALNAFGR
jgi:tetratricopeptide (TPR) repeat protein